MSVSQISASYAPGLIGGTRQRESGGGSVVSAITSAYLNSQALLIVNQTSTSDRAFIFLGNQNRATDLNRQARGTSQRQSK